jgi:ABC-type phosphate transport system substrate-binding protein
VSILQLPSVLAIGYAELNLAQKASLGLGIVRIKNAAGEFVKPAEKTIAAAALEAKLTDDFRVSLTNTAGKEATRSAALPGFTFQRRRKTAERGRAVADYLRWIYGDGQKIAQEQAIRHVADRAPDQGRIGGADGSLVTRRG